MDYKLQAGLNKKSFELNYNNGTIWCEHLDSMGNMEDEVINKFLGDCKEFLRPSVSSFMIINLDETVITDKIVECIVGSIVNCKKDFKKIAFVGIEKKKQKRFIPINEEKGAIIKFLFDYEKAKEWVID